MLESVNYGKPLMVSFKRLALPLLCSFLFCSSFYSYNLVYEEVELSPSLHLGSFSHQLPVLEPGAMDILSRDTNSTSNDSAPAAESQESGGGQYVEKLLYQHCPTGHLCLTGIKEMIVPSVFVRRTHFDASSYVNLSDDKVLDNFQFISGVSENHALELQCVKTVREFFPHKSIIVYDLGLSNTSLEMYRQFCNVQIRTFNFSAYPAHVEDLLTYAFKPIIAYEALREFPAVFWVDSSTKFLKSDLSDLYNVARSTGGIAGAYSPDHSVFSATHPSVYEYFNAGLGDQLSHLKTSSAISRGVAAGVMLYYRTELTCLELFRWAYFCALDLNLCMAPPGSTRDCVFAEDRDGVYANCHRQDQSVLSLLLANHFYFKKIRYAANARICTRGGKLDAGNITALQHSNSRVNCVFDTMST